MSPPFTKFELAIGIQRLCPALTRKTLPNAKRLINHIAEALAFAVVANVLPEKELINFLPFNLCESFGAGLFSV